MALQVLFETDLTGHEPREALAHAFASDSASDEAEDPTPEEFAPEIPAEVREYTERLVHGVLVNVYRIDPMLTDAAPAFTGEQTPLVDRNVLRLAVYELLHQTDVPPKVVINEAIELAKHFGGEGSGKFVNGVLGTVFGRLQRAASVAVTDDGPTLEPVAGG